MIDITNQITLNAVLVIHMEINMKKIMLLCLLALCNSFIYGSNDIEADRKAAANFEKYLVFIEEIKRKIPNLVEKDNLEEIQRYSRTFFPEINNLLRHYSKAIFGQIMFLDYIKKLIPCTGQVFLIQETELSRTDLVKLYVESYEAFLKS